MESITNNNNTLPHPIFKENYFKGKVMVLTGGTSKMLYQPALEFMKLGGKVALLSRRIKELEKVAENLIKESNSQARSARGYQIDLKKADDSTYEKVVEDILQDFGRIDILVNGAAGNFLADAEKLSLNAFKTVIEIDTIGTFMMSKHVFIKWMKKNGGSIINISASLHYLGTLMNSHASAAKAGVDAITKTLALEWGPKGVRVNGVAPGFIEGTEGFERLMDLNKANSKQNVNSTTSVGKDLIEQSRQIIPLQRFGNRKDIANTVLFLASDLSSYMTGQSLLVDGGVLGTAPNWLVYMPDFMKKWTAKF
jgi:2,4-dienoyl-CoA reductase [(3E)-enoyl-CoA-producing], peroxisomal